MNNVRARRKALDRILELARKALSAEAPIRVAIIITLVGSAPPPNRGAPYDTSSQLVESSPLEEERRRW